MKAQSRFVLFIITTNMHLRIALFRILLHLGTVFKHVNVIASA